MPKKDGESLSAVACVARIQQQHLDWMGWSGYVQQTNSTDPAKVGAAIAAGSYQGVAGTYAFDAKGDMKSSPVTIFTFKGGQPVAITSY